jgi:hypothetical protein
VFYFHGLWELIRPLHQPDTCPELNLTQAVTAWLEGLTDAAWIAQEVSLQHIDCEPGGRRLSP